MRARGRWSWIVAAVVSCCVASWADRAAMAASGPPPLKLSQYVAGDFCAAIVVHPHRMAQSPMLAKLPQAPEKPAVPPVVPGVDLSELNTLLKPLNLRRIVVLIDPLPKDNLAFFPGVIFQFEEEVAGNELLAKVFSDLEAAEFKGQKYQKSAAAGAALGNVPLGLHWGDPWTLIVAPEPTLQKMLAVAGPQPLLEPLRKAGLKNDVLVQVMAEPILAAYQRASGQTPEQLKAAMAGNPAGMFIGEVTAAGLTLNLSGDMLCELRVATKSDAVAGQLVGLAGMGLAMGKQQFAALKDAPPPQIPPPLVEPVMTVGQQILDGMQAKQEGSEAVLSIKMPAGLPKLLETAATMATAMAGTKP